MSADTFRGWTERDHADKYIAEAMCPLLELADAFPKMIELVAEHLMARFGNAESEETRIPDDDVICVWGSLASFVDGMQEMLTADRPGAMKGMIRLQRVSHAEPEAAQRARRVSAIAEAQSEP